MKISVLCPNLSSNCLGRAYLLAKILQRRYQVEIVGPIFGEGIWKPLSSDNSIPYKSVPMVGRLKPYLQIKELVKKIEGDVIYASKPLFTSLGVACLKKSIDKTPVVLDIDDWELAFIKGLYHNLSFQNQLKFIICSTLYLYRIESYWNNLLSEKLSGLANEITVSNSFLQKKFGGEIVWHARDTESFSPEKFDKNTLKEKYNLPKEKRIIMFFGTPRPYKGVEDLITAISLLEIPDIILCIVGMSNTPYCLHLTKTARQILPQRFKEFPMQPFEKVPEFLSLSDLVVIPQRKNITTQGQIPAKIFDAMAMAKPIIATHVSDLPEILKECGWIIEPNKPEILAKTITSVLRDQEEAIKIGQKARQKCIKEYSWETMEHTLAQIFEKYK